MSEPVETQDISIGLTVKLAGGAFAMLGACALLIVCMAPESLHPRKLDLPAAAGPVLQISPRADMARFRAAERDEMNSYGWVDRDRGVVRLPIDKAIERVARDGIPGWPEGAK